MKPGNSKGAEKDAKTCSVHWKVHDLVQSFVSLLYTMDESHVAKTFLLVSSSVSSVVTNKSCFQCAWSRLKKRTKAYNKEHCQVSLSFPLIHY